MAIKHSFVSAKPAGADTSLVRSPDWNADHIIEAGTITTTQLGGDITAAGRALLDDADAAAQRTTLGLAAIAATGSASDLSAGSVPAARFGDNTVALTKLANAAGAALLGALGAGPIAALTGTQATTLLDAFTSGLKGLTPASGGGAVNFLRADGSWAPPASSTSGLWGDASGGNVTDPASPLTAHLFADTLTLSNGYSLDTGGFMIHAREINVATGTATIHRNGLPGGNATNDSPGSGVGAAAKAAAYYAGGGAGANSGPNTGGGSGSTPRGFATGSAAGAPAPSAGNAGTDGTPGGIGQGGGGGAGGAAASGTGGAGGAGGLNSALSASNGDIGVRASAIAGHPSRAATSWTGGGGGGGGGNGNTNAGGGGSGGGGGYVCVVVGAITGAGTLRIESKGGNGGNGATGTTGNNCGGGGGGGGAGGIVIAVVGSGTPVIDVSGGLGGAGGSAAGTGNPGGEGGAGGDGISKLFAA